MQRSALQITSLDLEIHRPIPSAFSRFLSRITLTGPISEMPHRGPDCTKAKRCKVGVTLRHEADALIILSCRHAVFRLYNGEISVSSSNNSHNFPNHEIVSFSTQHAAPNQSKALNTAVRYLVFGCLYCAVSSSARPDRSQIPSTANLINRDDSYSRRRDTLQMGNDMANCHRPALAGTKQERLNVAYELAE